MASLPEEAPIGAEWRGSGTVLVVDDEAEVRSVSARLLETFGYRVALAENGRNALELFRTAPSSYAAILLDLTMPKMGGIEAFTEMRRIRADLPVVLMSGYHEEAAISRLTGQGLARFVRKPFTSLELREVFRELMEPRTARAV